MGYKQHELPSSLAQFSPTQHFLFIYVLYFFFIKPGDSKTLQKRGGDLMNHSSSPQTLQKKLF